MGLFDMFGATGKSHHGPVFILNGKEFSPKDYGFTTINSSVEPMQGFMSALYKVEHAQNSGGILKIITNDPFPTEMNSIAMITAFFLVYPTIQHHIPPNILDEVRDGMTNGAKLIYKKLGDQSATDASMYIRDTIMYFAREIHKDLTSPNKQGTGDIKFDICNTTTAFSRISFHAYKNESDPHGHPQRTIDDMSIQQLSAALFSDTLNWIQNSNKITYQDGIR